jgi:hypothetical protein
MGVVACLLLQEEVGEAAVDTSPDSYLRNVHSPPTNNYHSEEGQQRRFTPLEPCLSLRHGKTQHDQHKAPWHDQCPGT